MTKEELLEMFKTSFTENNQFNFIQYDSEKLKKFFRETYKVITGKTIQPGDPMSDFIDYCIFIISILMERTNATGKQNLLEYAIDDALDELGKIPRIERNGEQPAMTRIKYTFNSASEVIYIPEGNRVAVGNLYFATVENKELEIGETEIYVAAECMTSGTVGNGFLPGQINVIVDPLSYLISVENSTTSSGGTEVEEDDSYRERIRIGPDGYSVAGPTNAYLFHTLTVNQGIADAFIDTVPGTGVVKIYPIMKDGRLPSDELLTEIKVTLSDENIRPLTDIVEVYKPEEISYDIDLTYYIEKGKDVVTIKANVAKAIDEYVLWQSRKLGRDINPDMLVTLLVKAGVKRSKIINPVFTKITQDTDRVGKIARLQNKNINYGGEESD